MKSYHTAAKQKKMSLQECLELGRRCAEGDPEAREKLIVSHMYLVDNVLFPYLNKGVDTDDLFQEGCYGLLKAVDMYDYKRGVLFSTYAVHWIKKQMRLAIRSQNIGLPMTLTQDEYYLLMTVCSFITHHTQEFNSEPTCEEIAENFNITIEQTERLLSIAKPFISIDNPIYPGFEVGKSSSAEDDFFDKQLILDDVLLTYREKNILARHYGFNLTGKKESLKEIAASMGLSYETIRLDHCSAKEKIKTKLSNHSNNI